MVSVLSALYTDQALKVPSLTRLEDPIGKWWQRTSGSPNEVLGSVGLGLGSRTTRRSTAPASVRTRSPPAPAGYRPAARMNDAPQRSSLYNVTHFPQPRRATSQSSICESTCDLRSCSVL